MVREFKLPDVGEGVAEGELVSWLVEPGDAVSEDQPVAEVETDKALVEVPAPVNGTVRELLAEEGEMVPVGNVIITFDVEGEDSGSAEAAESGEETRSEADTASESASVDAPAETGGDGEAAAGDPGATGADAEEPATSEGRIFAPPRVRRLAREEGVDLSTVEGSGPGGRITEGDVRAAAAGDSSTDSATDAGSAGDEATAGGEGDTASSEPAAASAASGTETTDGTESAGETAAASGATSGTGSAGTTSADVESADRERTLAAPATRRVAQEEGVDIDEVPAVEERDGEAFVTAEAVREYAEAQRTAQEADAEALSARGEPAEREEREPYRGVRKTIGEAMERSKFTAPHVTHHDEVDVTELVETRAELKERAAERGIRLTYMPFVMKAVVAALEAFPMMNAALDTENDEIVYKNYYNVGVATATDAGLMVPVVEDVDEKGLLQIASEMNELVEKARERSIAPDELRGSTFTITNVGGIGGEYATPILNHPEVGILALGEIKKKPRVVEADDGTESIEPRHVMTLSLSFDHRLIDGAIGARFTNQVMEYLENPSLLLLE